MSSPNKNNYTARDIEQYLAGRLTAPEMHAMEKAALDDPFLADAMEGYEMFRNQNLDKQLTALQQQLEQKKQGAKVIPLHSSKNGWWKAVAAVFVLGAAVLATYLFTKKNNTTGINQNQVAQVKTVATDSGLQINKPATVTMPASPQDEANKDNIAKLEPSKTKTPVITVISSNDAGKNLADVSDDETTGKPLMVVENSKAKEITHEPGAVVSRQNQASEMVNVTKKQVAKSVIDDDKSGSKIETASAAGKEAALNNYFTAQVVSADNTPLPFTNISVKKDNFGTYADAKGMLRLVSSDSVLNVELKSVGYLPKTILLYNNQPQTKIVLQEEVVDEKNKMVIGSNKVALQQRSGRVMLLADSVVNVEPADGWEKYNTYVANNLDIPEDMLKRDKHGEVELSFDVRKNGSISNIKVRKSLGTKYDEAAKRLLLEGPQWKVKNGKNNSASVKVKF